MKETQLQVNKPKQSVLGYILNAGALWASIFCPIIIIITGFVIPFGDVATRSYILKLISDMPGKIFLFLMISLPIWYALYRILYVLYDANIHPKRGKLLTYGLALAWTVHAYYILFMR